ncbi:hypothetical protein E2C01_072569 [Portunus trituberculatus]|uniref:Uncharacterized protein n=1 Tax=Portunus trituberculatus TaxID=210409 RepID=A0A5B7I2X4_PORTR|nr:hypothetical protein [Portunus trituberculatus]
MINTARKKRKPYHYNQTLWKVVEVQRRSVSEYGLKSGFGGGEELERDEGVREDQVRGRWVR